MKVRTARQQTLMSKKYYSMLLGGTLTMVMTSFLLMSDSIIAGAFLGSDAVQGITLVTPLFSLGSFFGSVISLGVPILYSAEMGKFNKDGADRVFGFGLLMSVVVAIAMFALTWLLGDMYLRSYSVSEEALAQARDYLFWMRFTIALMPLQMFFAATVYGDGDETIETAAHVVQGLGNIIFSIILSRIMGVSGIGFASFLFLAISILVLLLHFFKKSNTLHWNLFFSFDIAKKVVKYSIIDSSSYLFIAILTSVFNAFVSSEFGPEYLILASAITLCREFHLLFDGIGEAVGPIFSVYVGEENHDGLRTSFSLANKTAIVEGVIVTLVMLIVAPFIPRILDVTDPELANWVILGVRLISIGSIFISILYLLTSYYMVVDQIMIGVVACALRDAVLSIALGVIMGKAFGITGMFIGLGIAPIIAYVLFIVFLRMRYGKDDCPLLLSKVPGDDSAYNFNIEVEPEQIIALQKEVEALLIEEKVDRRTIGKIKLLVEELYMLIREKNEEKHVLSEFTIFIHPDNIKIITKDNGILFDISQEDVSVTSIASFAVSAYMEKLGEDRHHLTTMSFNRSAFIIKPDSTV